MSKYIGESIIKALHSAQFCESELRDLLGKCNPIMELVVRDYHRRSAALVLCLAQLYKAHDAEDETGECSEE